MAKLHSKKLFIKALNKKFGKDFDLAGQKVEYKRLGPEQSARKREFMEYAKKLEGKRGMTGYNPYVHAGGIPLGQRQLVPYKLSTTEYVVEGDDLHFVNNPAMQQMWDDIRRTIIVGLDMAHEVLEKRLGKEVTPETINNYLEILNHAMPGAAVVQEHMVETHPGLVDDCNVRVFTGDDNLADEIDDQYLIDINTLFPADQAETIKAAMGKTTWQAIHIPTVVVRSCDGGTTSRWSAMQLGMTFIDAYNMAAGEAAVADLAFAAKHAAVIQMSDMLPARRARGPNNPGGLSFGFMSDMVQTSRIKPQDPAYVSLNVVAAGSMLYDQIWLGSYMSGGVGFTQYATAAYTNDVLDDFSYYGVDYAVDKFGGFAKAKPTLEVAKELATEVTLYGLEQYEAFPTLFEDHFGGSQRAAVLAAASGITSAIATGNSQAGLAAWYLSMLVHKEAHGRLGFFGYDLQDQCGPTNVFSYQSDEGSPLEIRGANYPNYAMNVGHQGEYAGITSAAHAGRMDAFAINPLIKVCFANPYLVFDWGDIRKCFGQGGSREFRAAGERALVMPAL
ncbi:MAG: coenzyme-B sulfoethylthiotransferase subunit alpha [Methanotrichaceae archaeon]|nr:coenzyme-B sulfoethylthiotransferase subunit alpha [Methanotrichaceae archaeon]